MPRKSFPGSQLARDAERLIADDVSSPPEARPTLMDAIRQLGSWVERRSALGWTDTMIAALLTEAGYPISSGTLRCYRKRLRDERTISHAAVSETEQIGPPAVKSTVSPEAPLIETKTISQSVDAKETAKMPPPPSEGVPALSPARSQRLRTISVSGDNLPPPRA